MGYKVEELSRFGNLIEEQKENFEIENNRKLSNQEIADKLNIATGTMSQLRHDEDRIKSLSGKTLITLAEYFGVSIEYLLSMTEAKTNDLDIKSICDQTGLSVKALQNITQLVTGKTFLDDKVHPSEAFIKQIMNSFFENPELIKLMNYFIRYVYNHYLIVEEKDMHDKLFGYTQPISGFTSLVNSSNVSPNMFYWYKEQQEKEEKLGVDLETRRKQENERLLFHSERQWEKLLKQEKQKVKEAFKQKNEDLIIVKRKYELLEEYVSERCTPQELKYIIDRKATEDNLYTAVKFITHQVHLLRNPKPYIAFDDDTMTCEIQEPKTTVEIKKELMSDTVYDHNEIGYEAVVDIALYAEFLGAQKEIPDEKQCNNFKKQLKGEEN